MPKTNRDHTPDDDHILIAHCRHMLAKVTAELDADGHPDPQLDSEWWDLAKQISANGRRLGRPSTSRLC